NRISGEARDGRASLPLGAAASRIRLFRVDDVGRLLVLARVLVSIGRRGDRDFRNAGQRGVGGSQKRAGTQSSTGGGENGESASVLASQHTSRGPAERAYIFVIECRVQRGRDAR